MCHRVCVEVREICKAGSLHTLSVASRDGTQAIRLIQQAPYLLSNPTSPGSSVLELFNPNVIIHYRQCKNRRNSDHPYLNSRAKWTQMVETGHVAPEVWNTSIQTMSECCFHLYLWTSSLLFVRGTSIKKKWINTKSEKGVAKDHRRLKKKDWGESLQMDQARRERREAQRR